jgi:cytoskeletal protein CcmA (bactofilin family)
MLFRKKRGISIEVTKLSSLISQMMSVQGDVLFSGGLRVDGQVRGNVISKDDDHGLLVLSDKGSIAGGVKVYDAVINGVIQGDVEVEHFLELQANARVSGNISYRQLRMDCGATVDGKLECVDGEVARPVNQVPRVVPRVTQEKPAPRFVPGVTPEKSAPRVIPGVAQETPAPRVVPGVAPETLAPRVVPGVAQETLAPRVVPSVTQEKPEFRAMSVANRTMGTIPANSK